MRQRQHDVDEKRLVSHVWPTKISFSSISESENVDHRDRTLPIVKPDQWD